jgi:hypothetical protein
MDQPFKNKTSCTPVAWDLHHYTILIWESEKFGKREENCVDEIKSWLAKKRLSDEFCMSYNGMGQNK